MPPSLPLQPERLALYGDSLRPPRGTVFDAGVATTYSLDFETALAVPVALALFTHESRDELLRSPLTLLQGLDRIAGQLAIFCEAGRIQARATGQNRLCNLLERLIVEVDPPARGAFHPKTWVLRYRPLGKGQPTRMRLLVMSRNLTRDRSWDVSLCLDGTVSRGQRTLNLPLARLLERLPSMANQPLPRHVPELVSGLQGDLHRTDWTLPWPFEEVSFAFNGPRRRRWKPRHCRRLAVVSPFCDSSTLAMLAGLANEPKVLVSRSEELAAVDPGVVARFGKVSVLDELAQKEDGESENSEDDGAEPRSGLHAKVFVRERGWRTSITVGSGNATRPALLDNRNIEVLATLTGKRSQVGRIEEIFGRDGFGRILRQFRPGEIEAVGSELRAAEQRVEQARRELSGADLALHCMAEEDPSGSPRLWSMTLQIGNAVGIEGIGKAASWPVTRGDAHSVNVLAALREGGTVVLGRRLPLIDVTRFIAFRLEDAVRREAQALFALGLRIDGLPAHRQDAVLRWVLDSREAFLRYLRLLLADLSDPLAAQSAAGTADGTWKKSGARDDEPILEDMVRALTHGRDRLRAVRRVMERLECETYDASGQVVPEDFLKLWEAFRTVLEDEVLSNA